MVKSSTSRNSIALTASGLIAGLVQLFAVREYVILLGLPRYGVYSFVAAFTAYALLVTPALSMACQKRITEAFHAHDLDSAKKYQRTGSFLTLAFTVLGIAVFVGTGLFYSVPGAHLGRNELLALFSAATVIYCAALWNQMLVANLSANDRFQAVAAVQILDRLSGTIISIVCVYHFRSPLWILVGTGAGNVVALACNALVLKRLKTMALRPVNYVSESKDIRRLVTVGYPHRLLTAIGNSSDRLLFPYAHVQDSMARLGSYNVAYRIPELIQVALYQIINVVLPKITRLTASNSRELGPALDRYGIFVAVLGAVVILPISFAGQPLLRILLPSGATSETTLTMALIGVYFSAQMYISLFTQTYYASGELQYAAVFSGFNAAATLILTIPFARQFGIVGLGLMNAGIGLLQVFPYATFVKRTGKFDFPVRDHFKKLLAILGIGLAFSTAEYQFFSLPSFVNHSWYVVVVLPLTMSASLGLILLMKLSPLTHSLALRLVSRFRHAS